MNDYENALDDLIEEYGLDEYMNHDEAEADYRNALADHVQPRDYIESLEIRNKVGWDKFSPAQNMDMLIRKLSQ